MDLSGPGIDVKLKKRKKERKIRLGILGASCWPTPQILKGSTFRQFSYRKQAWLERGLFYQSNLATHLFPGRKFWLISKCLPQPRTLTHSNEIPWENVQKTS
jgi:hypothetical protein